MSRSRNRRNQQLQQRSERATLRRSGAPPGAKLVYGTLAVVMANALVLGLVRGMAAGGAVALIGLGVFVAAWGVLVLVHPTGSQLYVRWKAWLGRDPDDVDGSSRTNPWPRRFGGGSYVAMGLLCLYFGYQLSQQS